MEPITRARMVPFLNEILALDPDFMNGLGNHYVPCNEALANHPSVQVGLVEVHKAAAVGPTECFPQGVTYKTSIIGLLNGIFAEDQKKDPRIAKVVDDVGRIVRFEEIPPDKADGVAAPVAE